MRPLPLPPTVLRRHNNRMRWLWRTARFCRATIAPLVLCPQARIRTRSNKQDGVRPDFECRRDKSPVRNTCRRLRRQPRYGGYISFISHESVQIVSFFGRLRRFEDFGRLKTHLEIRVNVRKADDGLGVDDKNCRMRKDMVVIARGGIQIHLVSFHPSESGVVHFERDAECLHGAWHRCRKAACNRVCPSAWFRAACSADPC